MSTRVQQKQTGFTLIELMVVVAIIAMLGTLALPAYQSRIMQKQVESGVVLGDFAKQAIEDYYKKRRRLPANNAAAGLPPADQIIGLQVTALSVEKGALHIRYGNRANKRLHGRTLSLRPARIKKHPQVPIAWICGHSSVPDGMQVEGKNLTDLSPAQLPVECRR